ncbi:hypothetical protein FQN54_003639 [Arachnomyces sp. PD_36]|nr:hypothetical protein FQN54_003639 [Arachnomyces sp. PD_36]
MISSFTVAVAFYAATAASSPLSSSTSVGSDSRPTASIDSGVLVGTATSLPSATATVNQFLGVPFGAPPVRFSPPEPAQSWESPYDASEYKPACIQEFQYPEVVRNKTIEWFATPGPPAGESEDCLNLNVFTPAGAEEGSKAVIFWIYGGSFAFGAGSIPLYDGSSFATNQDVVVVTPNYRTNVFGFPGSSELPEGERNLGFLDQRLALDWVQRNIAAFGGDPDRVTIAGESAGGGSVDVLVTNPPEPVPFHAAIMQSGQGTLHTSAGASAGSWTELAEEFDCPPNDSIDCLREVPALELKNFIERHQLTFSPERDGGATWADNPREDRLNSTDEDPIIARVPIMIGSNADEGAVEALMQNSTEEWLRSSFGDAASDQIIQILLQQYAIGSPGISNDADQINAISTEFSVGCPAKIIAEDSEEVGIDAWRYYFNGSFPNSELFPTSGAYHTAEIELIFGTYEREGATEFQEEVSDAMQEAWANFAKDPSCGPGWDAAPKVGVFGGGARPGLSDSGRKALVAIDPEILDRRCVLFKTIYDAAQ